MLARRRVQDAVLSSGTAKFLTYRILAGLLGSVPEPVADLAGFAVGSGMWALQPENRAIVSRHMARIMGPGMAAATERRMVRRAFMSYARYWVEAARVSGYSPSTVREKMIRVEGLDHLAAAMGRGRGVIMAMGHLGGWELGGAWLADAGYPMTAVAEVIAPPALYEFFVKERSKLGLTIVPLGDTSGHELLRALRAGGLVGLICDRDLTGNGIEVELFGEKTRLPPGPAALALRTGAAVLPAAVYFGPRRGHDAVIRPPISYERRGALRDDVAGMTRAIAAELEKLIRRAPEQWHVFQPNWPSDQERS